jgi:hypothetical protein
VTWYSRTWVCLRLPGGFSLIPKNRFRSEPKKYFEALKGKEVFVELDQNSVKLGDEKMEAGIYNMVFILLMNI